MGTHGQKTFLFNGITLWNSLPTSVQSQQYSVGTFSNLRSKKLFSEISHKENAMYVLNMAEPYSACVMFGHFELVYFYRKNCSLLFALTENNTCNAHIFFHFYPIYLARPRTTVEIRVL